MYEPASNISPEFDAANPLGSALSVLRAVLFSPKRFFVGFRDDGSLKEPTLFVVLIAAVAAVMSLIVNVAGVALASGVSAGEAGLTALQALLFVVLSPAAVAVSAAVYLLAIRTFVGKVADYRSVYRMVCYSFGALILGWIPILGAFAVTFALLILMGTGIRFVYRTTFLTALVTALVSFVPLEIALIWLRVASAGMFAG